MHLFRSISKSWACETHVTFICKRLKQSMLYNVLTGQDLKTHIGYFMADANLPFAIIERSSFINLLGACNENASQMMVKADAIQNRISECMLSTANPTRSVFPRSKRSLLLPMLGLHPTWNPWWRSLLIGLTPTGKCNTYWWGFLLWWISAFS